MKYIAYCRKSQEEKDRQVLSIEAQIAELTEFARREGLQIVEFIEEAKTAKVPGRRGFEKLIKKIEKGEAQGILSWHPDRLARNSIDGGKIIYLLDTGKLFDLKFPQFWFDNTPQGKFMLNIAFGQSKYYIDNLSENVKRGQRQKLRNGQLPSKAPIGYINDPRTKNVQIDSDKAKIVKKAFILFASNSKSFTEIGLFLHKFGISQKDETPHKPDRVKRFLTNRFYVGIMTFKRENYLGSYELFISKELFNKVQKLVQRIERPRKHGHNFPFLGLARCGECGAAVTCEAHTKKYKNGTKQTFTYYRCTRKLSPCRQKFVSGGSFEQQIRQILEKAALPPSWAKDWYTWLEEDEAKEKTLSEENIRYAENELKILDAKLNKLLDTYLEGIIDPEIYKNKKNEIFEQKLKLQEEIAKIKQNGSSWLEPFKNFIGSALSCAKIARAKNTDQDLKILAKTVGSNFFLTNQRLDMEYNLGFAKLFASPPAKSQNPRLLSKSQSAGSQSKIWNPYIEV